MGVETTACGARGVYQGVTHVAHILHILLPRLSSSAAVSFLCLCSVWDVMVPPTVLESVGYQYYCFCRAVADRAYTVIGVQGR